MLCVLVAGVVPAAAVTAVSDNPPPNFVRHSTSKYWTWFGPRDWSGTYSPYGLTLTSPSGADVLDYGFSTIACAASPAAFFQQRRAQLLASLQLGGLRFFGISGIRGLGASTFEQTLNFAGRNPGAAAIRGELVLTYGITSPPYCYGATLGRYAPSVRYAASIVTLRKIWQYTYYFGPGACLGTKTKPPCAKKKK